MPFSRNLRKNGKAGRDGQSEGQGPSLVSEVSSLFFFSFSLPELGELYNLVSRVCCLHSS